MIFVENRNISIEIKHILLVIIDKFFFFFFIINLPHKNFYDFKCGWQIYLTRRLEMKKVVSILTFSAFFGISNLFGVDSATLQAESKAHFDATQVLSKADRDFLFGAQDNSQEVLNVVMLSNEEMKATKGDFLSLIAFGSLINGNPKVCFAFICL